MTAQKGQIARITMNDTNPAHEGARNSVRAALPSVLPQTLDDPGAQARPPDTALAMLRSPESKPVSPEIVLPVEIVTAGNCPDRNKGYHDGPLPAWEDVEPG